MTWNQCSKVPVFAMTDLPDLAALPATLPKAAIDQLSVQAFEGGLLTLARVGHPTVAWWHGYRKIGDSYGSQCYVCDRVIAFWGGNSGPPMIARQIIDDHKINHRDGTLPADVPLTDKDQKS